MRYLVGFVCVLVGLAVSPLSIAAQDVDEATLEEKRGPDLEWLEWSDVEWTSWLLGTHQGIDLGLKSSAGAPSEGSWMRLELDNVGSASQPQSGLAREASEQGRLPLPVRAESMC